MLSLAALAVFFAGLLVTMPKPTPGQDQRRKERGASASSKKAASAKAKATPAKKAAKGSLDAKKAASGKDDAAKFTASGKDDAASESATKRKVTGKRAGGVEQLAADAAVMDAAAAEEWDKKQKAAAAASKQLKGVQANFCGQVGNAKGRLTAGTSKDRIKDEALVKAGAEYKNLGNLDPKKKLMLDAWAKDKSMHWWVQYEESRSREYEESHLGRAGFGTKFPICYWL
jgi:hypothetical protein